MRLSHRLDAIKPSPTLALNAKAKALAASGVDVVGFAAGEPDFDTPDWIKDAAIDAVRAGFTKYTATPGIPELRTAIGESLAATLGGTWAPEQILVSCGAKHSLYNAFQALLDPGDEVIIFSPYWVSYPDMVRLAGGEPVVVETSAENGFAPDPARLKKALGPKTRAVVINSPGNPSGAVLSRQALADIAEVLSGHDCWILTDDIYSKLRFSDAPFENILTVAPAFAERTLVIDGVSKAWSMTGWRIGWAAGPKALISGMQKVQGQSTSNPSSISQKAALAALKGPSAYLAKWLAEFRARRDLFVAGLASIDGFDCRVPDGAFYVFPSVKGLIGRTYRGPSGKEETLAGSVRISELLLEDFSVAAVPGFPFGMEGHLRMSFATSAQTIEKGLTRLREFAACVK